MNSLDRDHWNWDDEDVPWTDHEDGSLMGLGSIYCASPDEMGQLLAHAVVIAGWPKAWPMPATVRPPSLQLSPPSASRAVRGIWITVATAHAWTLADAIRHRESLPLPGRGRWVFSFWVFDFC
ncbi:hypothetical protein ACLOJK_019007 [Asimina triloba]